MPTIFGPLHPNTRETLKRLLSMDKHLLRRKVLWYLTRPMRPGAFLVRKMQYPVRTGQAGRPVSFVNQKFLEAKRAAPNPDLLKEAERICGNRYNLHGFGEVSWEPPQTPWRTWSPTAVRLFNRHDFLITLVRAWQQDGGIDYRSKLERLLPELITAYPIEAVKKYDKAIDIAIRLLNWSAVVTLLGGVRWTDPQLRHWYLQIEWLRAGLSPGGNHLLLEGLGLYAAGLFWAEIKGSNRWRRQGRRIAIREMQNQVWPDGIHAEQSMFYQQVCTTHFLKFALLSQAAGENLPSAFLNRLLAMLAYVWHTRKPDGTHPMIGDGDQMVGQGREHWEARALVAVFLHLQGHSSDTDASRQQSCDTETTGWFAPLRREPFGQLPTEETKTRSIVFPHGGHVVLCHDAGHYLFFNCGSFGFEPHPHHGHADALSVEICLNNRSLVMDPGGYRYTADPIRSFMRGTAAHSTISINGRNQSKVFGVFGVGQCASAKINGVRFTSALDQVEAEHDGYAPLIHRRRILFIKSPLIGYLIFDRIIWPEGRTSGGGAEGDVTEDKSYGIQLAYHLAPEVDCRRLPSGGFKYISNGKALGSGGVISRGAAKLTVNQGMTDSQIHSLMAPSCENVVAGTRLALNAHAKPPVEFITLFSPHLDLSWDCEFSTGIVKMQTNDRETTIALNGELNLN